MAVPADGHFGVAAPFEKLADAVADFVDDPRTQRVSDSDVFAGNLDLHGITPCLSDRPVKRG
jgi:hypothetical protein